MNNKGNFIVQFVLVPTFSKKKKKKRKKVHIRPSITFKLFFQKKKKNFLTWLENQQRKEGMSNVNVFYHLSSKCLLH